MAWFLFGRWQAGLGGFLFAVVVQAAILIPTTPRPSHGPHPGKGRVRTERDLRALEESGFRVLHSRVVPGPDKEVDHLVVGPYGTFALISVQWRRQVPIRMVGQDLFRGPSSQRRLIESARTAATAAAQLLRSEVGQRVDVIPVVVIRGPRVPWKDMLSRGVHVVSPRQLRRLVRRGPQQLTFVEVERIAQAAEAAFPPPEQVAQRS
jgi:hypothetical protein